MADETRYIRNNIFLEMQNYSVGLNETHFSTKEVEKRKDQKYYTLYEDSNGLYILTPLPNMDAKKMMMVMSPMGPVMLPYVKSETKALKIWYPKAQYLKRLHAMYKRLLWQFVLFALGALVLSFFAARYTLRPLRSSLRLLEDFIKDITHDLNTPLSAIRLNLEMIDRNDAEIESIRTATQTIEMLHRNLDGYLKEGQESQEQFSLYEVVTHHAAFFKPLYDRLHWDVRVDEQTLLFTDKEAFSRIVYNLLSNACKYNTVEGSVEVYWEDTVLTIRNSSYGVKHPERVFDRFYRESERGLGIGLHIVEKLSKGLGIVPRFRVEGTDVVVTLACEEVVIGD